MLKSDRKPRMLVLSSTFPRWENDTEPRFVLDLCRQLSGHAEILVLAPHTPGAALDEMIDGVRVRRFRYFVPTWQAVAYQGGIVARIREQPWRVLQLPLFLVALWRATSHLISDWKPDLIHAHWIVPQGFVACLAAQGQVPVLCTSHGGDLHGLRSFLFRRAKQWTLRRCRHITVVSQSMVKEVRSFTRDVPINVIPMGTDLSTLFVPPADPATRRKNEIIFVGRLVEKKGVRFLLEAFEKLRQDQFDLNLSIAGDGPLRGEIERQVSAMSLDGHVKLLGSIPHAALPAIYQRATVAVFPFVVAKGGDQEGFGLVVVEAMGCGCPVIASDLPAIRDNIEDGNNGVLTPPGDSASLAEALRRCLANESKRSRLAANGLDSVRKRFDWTNIAADYWAIVENDLHGMSGTCSMNGPKC